MESYRSGGIFAVIIGIAAMLLGFFSIFTCFGNNAIINTGGGNVLNVLASIATLIFGFMIWRGRNNLAAVIFALLLISLVVYGKYKFDGQRAVSVAAAAGSAAISAAGSAVTAAGGAAITSVSSANVVNTPAQKSTGGLKGGHRWLTQKELQWCTNKRSTSLGCQTKQCAINKCGPKGK